MEKFTPFLSEATRGQHSCNEVCLASLRSRSSIIWRKPDFNYGKEGVFVSAILAPLYARTSSGSRKREVLGAFLRGNFLELQFLGVLKVTCILLSPAACKLHRVASIVVDPQTMSEPFLEKVINIDKYVFLRNIGYIQYIHRIQYIGLCKRLCFLIFIIF